MAEEPIAFVRAGASVAARTESTGGAGVVQQVRFDRAELNRILTIYGRMVAAGEWRDYAIDFLEEAAVFSIFRRTSEMPLYRVEKRPKLRGKQGMYAVITATGLILKRGPDLAQVLHAFDKAVMKATSA
jgi:hypothetical protein